MNLKEEYIQYSLQFSLALLAASAAFFFDPYQPLSYLTLLLIPALFGYTAYISSDRFQRSSFLGIISIFLAPLGALMAFITLFISIGNIFVSVFASGESFRRYYSATSLPLLLTGLILGAGLFGFIQYDPGVENEIRDQTAHVFSINAERIADDSGMIEAQKKAQLEVVEQVSEQTVNATHLYVINEAGDSLYHAEDEVNQAFINAEQEIPEEMRDGAESTIEEHQPEISEGVRNVVEENLHGSIFILLIPILAVSMFSIQPLVGLLTALWASVFARMSAKEELS